MGMEFRILVLATASAAGLMFGCRSGLRTESAQDNGSTQEGAMKRDVTPQEARELIQSERYLYVDVRTVTEYQEGHPSGSWNVPVVQPDETGTMAENPDFLRVMEANFPKDAPLVIGCRSGGRSSMATDMLRQAGYTRVYNIMGGYGGGRTGTGQEIKGWSQLGYPIDRDAGGERSYQQLRTKGGGD
jgi:rhodanese-related sulfurtransferase